ncbi:MAG: hypothetical protein V4640_09350 [Verrucomicrobiota bacterium]
MKRNVSFSLLVLAAALGLSACADSETKPAGPVSGSSQIPWNTPIAGQGQGQMGMMPQNQYRR